MLAVIHPNSTRVTAPLSSFLTSVDEVARRSPPSRGPPSKQPRLTSRL